MKGNNIGSSEWSMRDCFVLLILDLNEEVMRRLRKVLMEDMTLKTGELGKEFGRHIILRVWLGRAQWRR